MRTILISFSVLFLVACGNSTPQLSASVLAPESQQIMPTNYTYRISGLGVTYAAVIYTNFGSPNQVEQDVVLTSISDATPTDNIVSGENTVAEFANHSGGTLTVEALRDGVSIETKTATPGNSIHFNIDIE